MCISDKCPGDTDGWGPGLRTTDPQNTLPQLAALSHRLSSLLCNLAWRPPESTTTTEIHMSNPWVTQPRPSLSSPGFHDLTLSHFLLPLCLLFRGAFPVTSPARHVFLLSPGRCLRLLLFSLCIIPGRPHPCLQLIVSMPLTPN